MWSTRRKKSPKTCRGSNKSAGNPDRSWWPQRKLAFSCSGAETSNSFPASEKRSHWRRHHVPSSSSSSSPRVQGRGERHHVTQDSQQLAHNTGDYNRLYPTRALTRERTIPPHSPAEISPALRRKAFITRRDLGRTFAINCTARQFATFAHSFPASA